MTYFHRDTVTQCYYLCCDSCFCAHMEFSRIWPHLCVSAELDRFLSFVSAFTFLSYFLRGQFVTYLMSDSIGDHKLLLLYDHRLAPWSLSFTQQQIPPPNPQFSRSPLRLFAQAVALKTTHSVWMFFSQARAAGYMFAFPSLSKAIFTSGTEQKESTLYESMQIRVGSSTLKPSAPLVCERRRELSWTKIYLFLQKGSFIQVYLLWSLLHFGTILHLQSR